jgi:hypothetical protein
VNILDENIPASQRQLLKSWRIRVYQIGYDVSRKGIKDDAIIPFLLEQRRPTFFTRDLGFYECRLCHPDYSLVCLAVKRSETAAFVRRLLRYPEFNTKAKRLGKVIRVSQTGLQVWQRHAEKELFLFWDR